MPKETEKSYTVHLYATVRVPFRGIIASSQQDAIKQAVESADFDVLIQHPEYEYADEISYALVDEDGDDGYRRTTGYKPTGDKWVVDNPSGRPEITRQDWADILLECPGCADRRSVEG